MIEHSLSIVVNKHVFNSYLPVLSSINVISDFNKLLIG